MEFRVSAGDHGLYPGGADWAANVSLKFRPLLCLDAATIKEAHEEALGRWIVVELESLNRHGRTDQARYAQPLKEGTYLCIVFVATIDGLTAPFAKQVPNIRFALEKAPCEDEPKHASPSLLKFGIVSAVSCQETPGDSRADITGIQAPLDPLGNELGRQWP